MIKKILKYAFAILGYVLAGVGTYWGFNHCSSKEQSLAKKLDQVQTIKQNPIGSFVDSEGREHIKFKDGSVAKLPENKPKQMLYKFLRDSVLSPVDLLGKSDVTVTSVSKVETKTTGSVSKAVIDSLPHVESIQLDKWMTLYPDKLGGFKYALNGSLNNARYTEKSGLFNLKRTPYISFFAENPNEKITGYSKWDYPLPVVQPVFKVYAEAEYDIALKQPRTDIGASIRLGKMEIVGYGRLGYNPALNPTLFNFDNRSFTPSYGVKLKYNFIQL
jgi:hypothetical protein